MRLFAKCIEATSRAGFIHAQHHAGGIYRRAGHVRRNGGHVAGIPAVTFTGIVRHVAGITGHVRPEYSLSNRAQVLANMVGVADHWRTFLRACTAEGEDLSKLDAFSDEVTSFKQWATDGLNELKELGAGESLADGEEPPSDGGP